MPVYNTGEFIRKTLFSVTSQTLRDMEIILIDDGSTDDGPEIMKRMATEDGRIICLHQPNSGQSVARNNGIARARGEYIYFMDSDDLLDPDTLQRCYEKCERERLDFVFFDADIFSDDPGADQIFRDDFYKRTDGLEDRVYGGVEIFGILTGRLKFRVSPCLSFIRADLLHRNGLQFYPGIIHEDELFTPQYYLLAQRVGFISEPFFHRRIRGGSTMTTTFGRKNMAGYFAAFDGLDKFRHTLPPESAEVLGVHMKNLLGAVIYKARVMPLLGRLSFARRCIGRYRSYVSATDVVRLIINPRK